MSSIFVTGTDTDAGKTFVACALVTALRQRGLRVAVMKPISAGCETTPHGLRNSDALQLIEASGLDLQYDDVNPFAFEPAIAPHIAALDARQPIDPTVIFAAQRRLEAVSDIVVIEGAGGWMVPLGPQQTFADVVVEAGWPVLLVVGMRLGCLNHATLTADAICRRTRLAGWVANQLPPVMDRFDDNLSALFTRVRAPLWAALPAASDGAYKGAASLLDVALHDGELRCGAFAPD